MVVLVVLAMLILPCANAQMGGRSSRGGMGSGMVGAERDGGPGSRNGDRDYRRGGGRGRPGGRGGMQSIEDLSENQIDRILKQLSMRDMIIAEQLEELRKTNKEQFKNDFKKHAFPEIMNVMREDRDYRRILVWCEKYVADEAKGISELKEENYELYKKRLDALKDKYFSLIYNRRISDKLMHISVRDLKLNIKLWDLAREYRNSSLNQEQKESIESELEEVLNEQYDLNIQKRIIQYQDIQDEIKRLEKLVEKQIEDVNEWKDPEFKENEIKNRFEGIIKPTRSSYSPFRFGFHPIPMSPPDQNSNPAP
jgi:ribosomal protein L29